MQYFDENAGKKLLNRKKYFIIKAIVVYGSQGVCKVTDVGCLNLPGAPDDRLYYTLEPCHILGGKVFTPVDNQKAIIRPVISKDHLSL